jgi:ABC-type lipoprotein release transport system permease subunit
MAYAGMNMSMVIYPGLNLGQLAIGSAAVVLTALLASLWPAARAARLQPTRALRA